MIATDQPPERHCASCRHYVETSNAYGGGCHGPGAWIFGTKAKEWTRDRETFQRAAAAVGLYQYQWSGRAVAPNDLCDNHETQEEAAAAGVPLHERLPIDKRTRRFFP